MQNLTKGTSFATIYDSFLARVTSDMYMELSELDTFEMLQELLINAIPRFEFPRFDITNYELDEVGLVEEFDLWFEIFMGSFDDGTLGDAEIFA